MIFALVWLLAAQVPDVTDSEVWNEGVGYYEAGDVTNALRVLRPLMLSKTHGARAAEVVAKLQFEAGEREDAAAAAQIALRAHPDDPRANRNFTRAVDGLAALREAKRVEAILKAAEGRDPGGMLLAAARDTRGLMTEALSYRTNAAEKAVADADRLSKRAAKTAETWIPVREGIVQAVTNEEQAAAFLARIEQAERAAKAAAVQLADFDDGAYPSLAESEESLTGFAKLVVLPPQAIDEDILAQTNAWQDVEPVNGRAWQQDALDYTRSFRSKFPAWAKAYEQAAQSDTNKPPFTAEAQARISALATEAEKLQIECVEKNLPPQQEEALAILQEIKELLPKDGKSGGGQQNQPNQQNQQQDQQQNQQPDQQQGQQDQENEQNQDESSGDEEESEQEAAAEESEQDEEDREVEALLQKAQERSDEHEADKKARMKKSKLPPNERDW